MKADADIYIINRENVQWMVDKVPFNFDMVVVDELSSFKNHETKRFRALMKVRPKAKKDRGVDRYAFEQRTNGFVCGVQAAGYG